MEGECTGRSFNVLFVLVYIVFMVVRFNIVVCLFFSFQLLRVFAVLCVLCCEQFVFNC